MYKLKSPLLFTSIFVEGMEVLEYHQKFAVQRSTFLGSTYIKTTWKIIFKLMCVYRYIFNVCPFTSFCL